jgi:hypothetical protein
MRELFEAFRNDEVEPSFPDSNSERAGPPLCKGYLSQSEIRRSQLLQITGGDCFVDLHTSPIQQGELRRLIRALEFISSESCPLSLPPF